MAKRKVPEPAKRGPKEETLRLKGDWQEAVKEALKVPPPPPAPPRKGKRK